MGTNKKIEGEASPSTKILRIIDANLNRLREGLRVLEDIFRFGYNHKSLAIKLKNFRHLSRIEIDGLLASRDIQNDVSKASTKSELSRECFEDIIVANIKRAQESARVLEEVLKSINVEKSASFKNIRYELYQIEKELHQALCNSQLEK